HRKAIGMRMSARHIFLMLSWRVRNFLNARRVRRMFPEGEIKPVIEANRATLRQVTQWITDDVYNQSLMQYGLPENRRHLIDTEIPDEITYTDAILYLSRFLKKRLTYLEIGVS